VQRYSPKPREKGTEGLVFYSEPHLSTSQKKEIQYKTWKRRLAECRNTTRKGVPMKDLVV
jgi:hypothetical protein